MEVGGGENTTTAQRCRRRGARASLRRPQVTWPSRRQALEVPPWRCCFSSVSFFLLLFFLVGPSPDPWLTKMRRYLAPSLFFFVFPLWFRVPCHITPHFKKLAEVTPHTLSKSKNQKEIKSSSLLNALRKFVLHDTPTHFHTKCPTRPDTILRTISNFKVSVTV